MSNVSGIVPLFGYPIKGFLFINPQKTPFDNPVKGKKDTKKKFTFITGTILTNRATKELFRQEKINANTGHVYAMRFFPGQENDRIYCQKIERNGVTYVILCNLLERKKSTKLKHRENTLINQIARYEYKIE